MIFDESANPLLALGFTELEARIYMTLLTDSPATGYRIAKGLGKAAANTYKALESLEHKGAVVVEEGDHRLFRPVPPDDLLRQLDRGYRELRQRARQSLADLHRAERDDRVYRIRSADQVRERARRMLDEARQIVLLDVFPETLALLEDAIGRAVARGVLVGIKAYAPTRIAGAVVVTGRNADDVLARWPGRWLNVIADGDRAMVALLDRDLRGVVQAVWTECPYLAWVQQSAFSSELILTELDKRIEAGAPTADLQALLRDLSRLKARTAPGYVSIMRELADEPPPNGRG